MSLLLVYHDRSRAVVACDDRATYFDAEGSRHALADRVPKFATIGGMILGSVGRCDLARQLAHGTSRLVATEASFGLSSLADFLPQICRRVFAARRPLDIPATDDKIDVMLLGFDRLQCRIRCFVWGSEDGFKLIETTDASESNRIVALGAFDVSDEAALIELTRRCVKPKGTPWIASQLRDAVNAISAKWPEIIGPASFFAALSARGSVTLPKEFAAPPVEDVSPEAALTSLTAGRLYVGSVLTPAAGGWDTTGNNDGGSGAQYGTVTRILLTQASISNVGNGQIISALKMSDGDTTNHGSFQVTGNGSNNQAQCAFFGAAGVFGSYQSVTLKILAGISQANLAGSGSPLGQATIDVMVNGSVVATLLSQSPPAITGKQLYTYAFGPGVLNLAQVGFFIFALANSVATSGSVSLDIYEAWIEAVE